jgi:multidrug efflux pump subunit AcrB
MKTEKTSPIARLGIYFSKNYRITIIAILILVGFGFLTYAKFLKREGFPSVDIPYVIVQSQYFVNDANKVDTEVTTKILDEISDVDQVKEIQSNSTDYGSIIFVEFESGLTSEDGAKLLKDELNGQDILPEGVKPEFITIAADKVNGIYDLVFSISADRSVTDLQTKASEIAEEIKKVSLVADAEYMPIVEERTDFRTGRTVTLQTGFNRVGSKNNGELEFKPAINIGVNKKNKDIGTLEISEAIREKIEDLKKEGKLDGYEVTYGFDLADTLEYQLDSLQENAIVAVITILVVLFFFINWRAATVLGLFLPLTLGGVFIALYLIGYSLNTISLFALILVLGLFVDDGTIVVEAIDYYKKKGIKGREALIAAINDIGVPDMIGTLTTLLVFVPLIFVSGILGDFIRLLPITVILALAISLIIALTILPTLTNIAVRDEKEKTAHKGSIQKLINVLLYGFTNSILKIGEYISSFISFYLRKWYLTLGILIISIVLIGVGLATAGMLKFNVFPPTKDSNFITMSLSFPNNTDVEVAEDLTIKLEESMQENLGEYIESIDYLEGNESDVYVSIALTDMGKRKTTSVEIANKINSKIVKIDGLQGEAVSQGAGPGASEFPFAMQVFATDQEVLENATKDISEFIKNKDVGDDVKVTTVVVDNLATISKIDNRRFAEVRAKFTDNSNTGAVLKLEYLIKEEYGSEKLESLGLNEESLGFDFGQESENLESFNSVIFAALAALVVMYILLVVQFNSFSQPLLVLLAIPLSFPGLFPGLYLTDNPFSFFVMIGVTGLIGIVVNNTIMLISYANNNRRNGKSISESISRAVKARFRPILSTSSVTIAGLLPLALTDPFWEGLAFTIIFGLISSVILVIFAFPAYYAVFEKMRNYKDRLFPGLKSE